MRGELGRGWLDGQTGVRSLDDQRRPAAGRQSLVLRRQGRGQAPGGTAEARARAEVMGMGMGMVMAMAMAMVMAIAMGARAGRGW